MRHAEHDVAGAALGGALDREVEHRHEHVHAFDRESLLAEVGLVQEPLERLDLGEALEQPALFVWCPSASGRHRTRSSPGATRAPRASTMCSISYAIVPQ